MQYAQLKIDNRLITAKKHMFEEFHKNPESLDFKKWNIIYNILGESICKKFLLSLTGNESFYSELFRGYNNKSVYLDINAITYNFPDILGDYTNYRDYL